MSKKLKVIVSVLVAVLLLATSGTAVVMAQDEPEPTPQVTAEGLLDRIASILGITPQELTDAFNQAQQEMQEECLVTGNCCGICQQNANQFKERWMEKRQQRGEGNQQWMEKRQQRNQRLQCDGTQQKARFRISQSSRGRQMITVPEGWQGSLSPGQID